MRFVPGQVVIASRRRFPCLADIRVVSAIGPLAADRCSSIDMYEEASRRAVPEHEVAIGIGGRPNRFLSPVHRHCYPFQWTVDGVGSL